MLVDKRLATAWIAALAMGLGPIAGCGGDGGGGGASVRVLVEECVAEGLSQDLCESSILSDDDCAEDDSSCVTGSYIDDIKASNSHSKLPIVLALSFKALANDEAEDAKDILSEAGIPSADHSPETYTYALASVKVAIDSVAPLISFATGNAPGFVPAQSDQRSVLESLLNPIVAELEDVEEAVALIIDSTQTDDTRVNDTFVNILSLPIDLDLSDIDDSLPADLDVDVRGEWDRVELVLLQAASSGLLGLVDFILAHDLSLNINDLLDLFDDISTASLAEFFVDNDTLLEMDRPERLADAKASLVTVLDVLVGTADGDPGKNGLLAIIDSELESGEDQSDDVIQFVDNGDGQVSDGDKLTLTVVERLADDVGDIDGDGEDDLQEGDGTIDVGVSRGTWVGLTELGRELVDNLNGGDMLVGLQEHLSSGDPDNPRLWEDLQDAADTDLDPLEDWIFIDFNAYFENDASVRGLLPAVYELGDTVDVAFECEIGYTADEYLNPKTGDDCESDTDGLCDDSIIRILCGTGDGSTEMFLKRITFSDSNNTSTPDSGDVDSWHFAGMAAATDSTPATTETDLTAPTELDLAYVDGMGPVANSGALPLEADGFGAAIPSTDEPTPFNDINLYLLLQDPSIAGVLYLNLDGTGEADAELASHDSLNTLINDLWTTFGDDISEAISSAEE